MALSSDERVIFRVIFSILITISIIGNTVGIVTIMRHKILRKTPFYILLAHLCIADFIVAVFFFPRYIIDDAITYPGSSTTADFLCKFITYLGLAWVALQASVFTLVTIAFERYFVIVHPRSDYGRFTKRKLNIVVIACWFYSFLFNIPDLVSLQYNRKLDKCVNTWSAGTQTVASVFWFINNGPLPLIILGVLFGKMYLKISASWKTETAVSRRALLTSRKRVSQSALVAVLFYSVSWLPNLLLFLFSNYIEFSGADILMAVSHLMLLLYATVIPYVFMANDAQFKASLSQLFSRNNRVTDSSNETAQGDGVLKGVTLATPFVLTPRNDTEAPSSYDIPIWGADMDDGESEGKENEIPIPSVQVFDSSRQSNGQIKVDGKN